jgi:hypothetical protein
MQKQRRWLKQFYGGLNTSVPSSIKELKDENKGSELSNQSTAATVFGAQSGVNETNSSELKKDDESSSSAAIVNTANPNVLKTRKRTSKKNISASTEF